MTIDCEKALSLSRGKEDFERKGTSCEALKDIRGGEALKRRPKPYFPAMTGQAGIDR